MKVSIIDPSDPRILDYIGLRDHQLRRQREAPGGDLAGAVGELTDLGGAAALAAAPWLTGALARLDADLAVSEIEALAIARLQSGNGGS